MSKARWEEIESLFQQGSAMDPGERTRFVRSSAREASVADEVVSLLRHASAGDFLTQGSLGPAGNLASLASEFDADLQPGDRVDRYVIIRLIGRGGMSRVYAAEQESPRRTVALKIPSAGSVAAAWMGRRFQHEAACLGQLQHEGIARVYEAGLQCLADGSRRAYISMEYVPDSRRLTEYCTEHGVSIRGRVGLLARVCRAVQHGHQRGVIHLDLKPSNILVDGAGDPKVIDFGVARTSREVRREQGTEEVDEVCCGTPQYMSPEQFERRVGVDVRSDVYSLGVVLFELVAGRPPYDVTGLAMDRASEIVRGAPEASDELRRMGVDVDLCAIVETALAKDADRRYGSASAFADDLEAFASRRPLRSRRVGMARRVKLLIARRPLACIGGVAGLVLGAVGLAHVVQSDVAARRADHASATVLSLMKDMLASPKVRGNANVRLVEVLDDCAVRLDALEGIAPEAAEQMQATLAESYDLVGLYRQAERRFERAAELAERAYGVGDRRTIERQMGLAGSRFDLGHFEGAMEILDRVWPVVKAQEGDESLPAARVLNEYGLILFFEGRHAEAAAMHERVRAIYQSRLGRESVEHGQALHNVGVALLHEGRIAEAERTLEECLRTSLAHTPTLHAATPRARRWLAVVLTSQGRVEEAQRQCDTAWQELGTLVGEDHPFVAGLLDSMAFVAAARGDRAGAEALLRRSIAIFERAQGTDHPYTKGEVARLEDLREGRPLLASRVLRSQEASAGSGGRPAFLDPGEGLSKNLEK